MSRLETQKHTRTDTGSQEVKIRECFQRSFQTKRVNFGVAVSRRRVAVNTTSSPMEEVAVSIVRRVLPPDSNVPCQP